LRKQAPELCAGGPKVFNWMWRFGSTLPSPLRAPVASQGAGGGNAQRVRKNPQNLPLAVHFGPAPEQRAMTQQRYALRAAWETYFQNIDVFLSPVDLVPAFLNDHTSGACRLQTPEGDRPYGDQTRWVFLPGVTGRPATVAPVGPDARRPPLRNPDHGAFLRGWEHHRVRSPAEATVGRVCTAEGFCVTIVDGDLNSYSVVSPNWIAWLQLCLLV